MKVSTDACIQGAWTPLPEGPLRVLDIGTGTGLLSLMVAQRNPAAAIDAIEIDAAAALQARENVGNSPFAGQICIHHADARRFTPSAQYDLIICNPPFFKNSLRGPDNERNAARHNLFLQYEDIVRILLRYLDDNGCASLMWPVAEMEQWCAVAAASGLKICSDLHIRDRETAAAHRRVGLFSRQCTSSQKKELVIKDPSGNYTDAFRQLMTPFYLHL
jgi:tRNA1Val (adenine37-N6)-methyltransferase